MRVNAGHPSGGPALTRKKYPLSGAQCVTRLFRLCPESVLRFRSNYGVTEPHAWLFPINPAGKISSSSTMLRGLASLRRHYPTLFDPGKFPGAAFVNPPRMPDKSTWIRYHHGIPRAVRMTKSHCFSSPVRPPYAAWYSADSKETSTA